MNRGLRAVFAAVALAATAATASAAPEKTECLAGARPGGGFDLTCRLAANALLASKLISAPMAVTYMEGGVGAVAYNHVIGTRPKDPGLVIAASAGSALLLAQGKFGKHDESAVRWVGTLGAEFGVLAVRDDSPLKSLKDFAEAMKRNPADATVGGGGAVGSQDWMKAALVAKATGVDPKTIRYAAFEGGGQVLTALLGGHIKVMSGDAGELKPHLAAGKLRILAVMSERRLSGEFAAIPTAREQGLDIVWNVWRGFYVGPGVSDADYAWWVETLVKLHKTPEFAKERDERGLFAFELVGKDFGAFVKKQVQDFKALAKDAGL